MKVMLNGEELDGEDISVHLTEEGMYEATATSVDKAGNTSSESIKFYIDKTDPIATISGVKSNEHYQEVPEITIESNEEGIIHYEIIRNGESILVKESNNTVTYSDFKEDGSYQVVAYAVDKAGNKGSKTSQMFIKDTVSPTIELSGTSSGSYNNTNVSVNVRIVEENHEANNVSVVITRDGESETLGFNSSGVDSENVYTFKEDGFYVVAVSSIDKAGNQAETKSISFTIDTVNPVTTITGLAEGTHYRSVPEVKQEMNEEGALYIKAVRDGEEIYNGSDITKIDFSNDGNYTITGYSVDLAGNKSETLSYSFIKDSTAPIIILSGVEEGSYYNEDKEVKISVTERYFETNNVYVTVTRNGESSSNTFTSDGVISEMVIPFTNDGHYTVTVESTDKAGNSAASKEISFTVDKTLPLTAISGIEEGKHYQVVPTITGTANEDGTVFIKVVRDGAVIHEGEGKKEITFSDFKEDGDYEVTMYTIDLAGNKGEEVISKFVKDSTAPVLTLSGIEDKAISNVVGGVNLKVVERYFDKANVEVVLTRELNGKTVQVPVTVNLAGETTDIIIPLEEDGNYKLTVKTTDEAGNVSEEKTLTFTIDRTKPVVKITIPSLENGYYDVIDLRVLIEDDFFDSKEITLTKSGVGVVDFRNSESFNEKGGERVYEDFQKIKENDGVYTIIVKAKDKGGNETIEELTFVVDRFGSVFVIKKAPEVKYMKELKSAIVIEEINVAKTVSYDIFIHRDSDTKNAEGVKVEKNGNTTTYTIPVTNFIEEGIYRVDIITKDSAGNVSELKSDASSGIWFAIDKTAPIIAYNGLKDGETYIADYIDLYIGAQDTISPDVMLTAFIDGKEVEIKKDKQGKAYITVESGMNKTIEIKAVDTAGNEAIEQIKNVTISTNPVVRTYSNKPLMAGILGGLALLIGALIFFLLKRKKDEEGTDDIEF